MSKTPQTPAKLPPFSLHKCTGLFYVRLNGKRHYLGRDRAQAESLYRVAVAEWLGRGCVEPPPAQHEITVMELVDRYTAAMEVYYRASPKNLERILGGARPLLKLYSQHLVTEFTPAMLKVVRDEMIRMDWSRGYCNTATNAIRRIWKWGVSESLVSAENWKALESVEPLRAGFTDARETPPREGANLADIESVKHHLPVVVYDAARVLYLCGGRPSEVLTLRVGDIDRSDPAVWKARLKAHKTRYKGKTRTLFFGKAAQAILRGYMLKGPDAPVFSPAESMQMMRDRRRAERVTPDSCGNVPGSNVKGDPQRVPGEFYEPPAFNRAIQRACEKTNAERKAAGLEPIRPWTPYMLRHGRALELREKEGLDAVAAVLGHASLKMAEHYGKISEAVAATVAAKIG